MERTVSNSYIDFLEKYHNIYLMEIQKLNKACAKKNRQIENLKRKLENGDS